MGVWECWTTLGALFGSLAIFWQRQGTLEVSQVLQSCQRSSVPELMRWSQGRADTVGTYWPGPGGRGALALIDQFSLLLETPSFFPLIHCGQAWLRELNTDASELRPPHEWGAGGGVVAVENCCLSLHSLYQLALWLARARLRAVGNLAFWTGSKILFILVSLKCELHCEVTVCVFVLSSFVWKSIVSTYACLTLYDVGLPRWRQW